MAPPQADFRQRNGAARRARRRRRPQGLAPALPVPRGPGPAGPLRTEARPETAPRLRVARAVHRGAGPAASASRSSRLNTQLLLLHLRPLAAASLPARNVSFGGTPRGKLVLRDAEQGA